MSQLQQLKQQLAAVSADTKRAAQGLSSFKHKFANARTQVVATVGGSAQQIDKRLIATLEAAEKEVESALAALQTAADEASRYAQSL